MTDSKYQVHDAWPLRLSLIRRKHTLSPALRLLPDTHLLKVLLMVPRLCHHELSCPWVRHKESRGRSQEFRSNGLIDIILP